MFCLKIAAGEGRVKRWTARNGSGVGLEWMGADGQRGEFDWLARNVAAVPLGRGTFADRSGRRTGSVICLPFVRRFSVPSLFYLPAIYHPSPNQRLPLIFCG